MFFNPLFIQAMNGADTGLQRTQKLGNSSYLFSDIMNVQIQKGESLSETGKVVDGIALKDLQKLSDLMNLSDLSEEEVLEALSQLLAQFGLSGNILAQVASLDGAGTLSGSLTSPDVETEVLDLGSDVKEASLKIMELLKQNKDVVLQLADGEKNYLLKLQAQGDLHKKELMPLQENSKFALKVEKSPAASPETIKTVINAKEPQTERLSNKNIWTVEKSAEMLKALKPQKTVNAEGVKDSPITQNMASIKNAVELNVPVGKKEKIKTGRNTGKVEIAVDLKGSEKADKVERKVSFINEANGLTGDLKEEDLNLTSSIKLENSKPQETKISEVAGDKDFSQHILSADKEVKVESQSAVRNTAAAPFVKTVKAAEVMNEISQFIKQKDKQTVILKIEPENLGKIKIALEFSNASIDAKIHVESEQIKAMVESGAKQLTQSLVQNGIQLNSLTVSLSNSDQKLGRQPSFSNKKKGSGAKGDAEFEIEKTEVKDINKKLGYNTYEYLA